MSFCHLHKGVYPENVHTFCIVSLKLASFFVCVFGFSLKHYPKVKKHTDQTYSLKLSFNRPGGPGACNAGSGSAGGSRLCTGAQVELRCWRSGQRAEVCCQAGAAQHAGVHRRRQRGVQSLHTNTKLDVFCSVLNFLKKSLQKIWAALAIPTGVGSHFHVSKQFLSFM